MKSKFFLLLLAIAVGASAQNFVQFDEAMEGQQGRIAVADLNNNGNLDVIFNGVNIVGGAHNPKCDIWFNNGNLNFAKSTLANPILSGRWTTLKFADIDGDGDIDIIFTGLGAEGVGPNESKGIAINDGTGGFTLADTSQYPKIQGDNAWVSAAGFADFNNDGLLDYYFFGNHGNSDIFIQQKSGVFAAQNSVFRNLLFVDQDASVVDINGDGYLDFFFSAWDTRRPNVNGADAEWGRYCTSYINDGTGAFSELRQNNIVAKSGGSHHWADINGDGLLDLVLMGDGWITSGEDSDFIARVFQNINGTLTPKFVITQSRQISLGGGCLFGDINNDGKVDILIGGWCEAKGRQNTSVWYGDDTANFTFIEDNFWSNQILPGVSENSYELADIDNDGDLDFLIMGFNGNQTNNPVKLQRNVTGYVTNSTTVRSTKLTAPILNSAVIPNNPINNFDEPVVLSWQAPANIGSNKGVSYNMSLYNKTKGKWMYNPMAVIEGADNGKRKVTGMGNMQGLKAWELYELEEAEYEWTVQAINGSYVGGEFAAKQSFKIGNPSSINNIEAAKNLKVYAKSSILTVEINSSSKVESINIYSVDGAILKSYKGVNSINETMSNGIYLVEAIIDGSRAVQKVVL